MTVIELLTDPFLWFLVGLDCGIWVMVWATRPQRSVT